MNHSHSKVIFVLMTCMLALASAQNWQASGEGRNGWPGQPSDNLEPNLPTAYAIVDTAIADHSATNRTDLMARSISDGLGRLWDDAWNVAIVKLDGVDVNLVVFGYAFRFHWLWHNGYYGLSFVLWKDYNCF